MNDPDRPVPPEESRSDEVHWNPSKGSVCACFVIYTFFIALGLRKSIIFSVKLSLELPQLRKRSGNAADVILGKALIFSQYYPAVVDAEFAPGPKERGNGF